MQLARNAFPQAALLAGLPKGPSLYDPRRNPKQARERRDLVPGLMEAQKRITPEVAAAAVARRAPLRVVRKARTAKGTPTRTPEATPTAEPRRRPPCRLHSRPLCKVGLQLVPERVAQ